MLTLLPTMALKAWLTRLMLICLLCFLPNADGSTIVFKTSTNSIKPMISSNLTITCSLEDTSPVGSVVGRSLTGVEEETRADQQNSDAPNDKNDPTISKKSVTQTTENMQYVTSIIISRDGHDIATITEHFSARQVGGATGFQVSGQIPGTPDDKGHLQLSWTHPTQAESASYQCDISTLTSQGRSFYFSQSFDITEEEVSMDDLISEILQMKLEKEKTDIQMGKTIDDQAKTIERLNESLIALKQIARTEPNVFFSAAISSTRTIRVNQQVIYDKIFSNEGASYNSNTGTFTAPLDGFYHFEIHSYSVSGQESFLKLRLNNNDVIGLVIDGDDGHRGTSNSLTLKLAKDDKVNVVGSLRTSYLYQDQNIYFSNMLNGHLVSLV